MQAGETGLFRSPAAGGPHRELPVPSRSSRALGAHRGLGLGLGAVLGQPFFNLNFPHPPPRMWRRGEAGRGGERGGCAGAEGDAGASGDALSGGPGTALPLRCSRRPRRGVRTERRGCLPTS